MATMFAYDLKPDPTIAANMQRWAGWIESVLTTIDGWTVTADTGQTPPASLAGVNSATPNLKAGFRIYQMHDEFTDDFPIYMKLEFGNGAFTGGSPTWCYDIGITVSIGRATNGAGNLSGILWTGIEVIPQYPTLSGNNSNNLYDFESRNYASADQSRFVLGMFIEDAANQYGTAGSLAICFSFERSRDITGAYTGDGLQISYTHPYMNGGYGAVPALSGTKYIVCADGGQPPFERGVQYIYPGRSPVAVYDGRIPVALHYHSRGLAQQPGTNLAIIGANELLGESQFAMSLYGQDHVYQHLKYINTARTVAGTSNTALTDAGARVCMRYD